MYAPPSDPRDRTVPVTYSWGVVLSSLLAAAAVPVALWIIASPVTGIVVVAVLAGVSVAGRRLLAVARCVYVCGRCTFELAGRFRITVARPRAGESC